MVNNYFLTSTIWFLRSNGTVLFYSRCFLNLEFTLNVIFSAALNRPSSIAVRSGLVRWPAKNQNYLKVVFVCLFFSSFSFCLIMCVFVPLFPSHAAPLFSSYGPNGCRLVAQPQHQFPKPTVWHYGARWVKTPPTPINLNLSDSRYINLLCL